MVICNQGDGEAHSPLESLDQALGVALDFEDLDGAVAGARSQLAAVVVEDSIMLGELLSVQSGTHGGLFGRRELQQGIAQLRIASRRREGTYNHVIMTRVGDDLRRLRGLGVSFRACPDRWFGGVQRLQWPSRRRATYHLVGFSAGDSAHGREWEYGKVGRLRTRYRP